MLNVPRLYYATTTSTTTMYFFPFQCHCIVKPPKGSQRERSVTDSARDFHAADPGSNPGGGNNSHAIFVL